MAALDFLIIVAVSAIDPFAIGFYGAASYFARSWRQAAAFGAVAGLALVLLTLTLSAANRHQPRTISLVGQFFACIAGATAIRAAVNRLKPARAA